jgi:hypothetical protein
MKRYLLTFTDLGQEASGRKYEVPIDAKDDEGAQASAKKFLNDLDTAEIKDPQLTLGSRSISLD